MRDRVETTQGCNVVRALFAAQRGAGSPTRSVVVDDAGVWALWELEAAVARASGALRAHGVAAGDRVAIRLCAGRSWVQALLGTMALGAIAVPIDPDDDDSRTALLCDEVGAEFAVTDRDDPGFGGAIRITPTALDEGGPLGLGSVDAGDCALILFTSGSTGRPKGVMHTHGGLAEAGYVASVLGVGPGDRVHSPSGGFSALGLFIGILRPLMAGAAVVVTARRPTVRSVVRAAERGRATVLAAVPTFWAQLADFVERHPEEGGGLSRLRRAVASGESLPPALVRRIRTLLGLELLNGFGSAECGDIVVAANPGTPCEGVGVPVPDVEVMLAARRRRSRTRREGRLLVRCRTASVGYWQRSDETRETFAGEWLRTSDLMSVQDGVYRHHGRIDRAVNIGGRLLHTADAEACLCEHPAVREAVVMTVPGRREFREPVVFVRVASHDPELTRELRAMLAQRLGQSLSRARLTPVEGLPRLGSGKVDRQALLAQLAA